MSAIGSVMVIVLISLSRRGSRTHWWAYGEGEAWELPGSLRHAGQLALVGHVPQTHTAQPELAVDRFRTAALLAAGVGTHRELRLGGSLNDQRLLSHAQFSLNGKPRAFSSARPSSS